MPSIKQVNVATTANAVDGLQFQEIGPSIINLYASCVTSTDLIGLSVGSDSFLVDGAPNLESTDIVDVARDQILFDEPVPGGKLFIPITASTAVNFLLAIEEVPFG